ncbi:hypothetical protein SLEP1_g5435 [Rubroshorea leprosula]|uniref:XS domain-containing protein n=2 Tax=Rubroshorea leprosula TaxID=152421 RepID=A0AAV5HXR8_9ROSI|nr:hypothetical protein SLEP1_g5435 [Rubroshorea leprosula]
MQSRRNEERISPPASIKMRSRQHRDEIDHDPYRVSRREVMNRPSRRQRSASPRAVDGSRRVLVRERRSGSIEKKEGLQAWQYGGGGGGGRTEKDRSRSPPYRQLRKLPHPQEEIVNRKYDYDALDVEHGATSRSKHVYGYDHGTSRISKESDFIENRIGVVDEHVQLSQKLLPVEDVEIRGSRRLPSDMGPTSNYEETGGRIPFSSHSMDIDRYEHKKPRYQDSIASEKLMPMESYKGEKPMFHSRDVSYSTVPASHSKNFASTSSAMARNEYPNSYRGNGAPLPEPEEYSRSTGKVAEPVGYSTYESRVLLDSAVNSTAARRNASLYQRAVYSPGRAEPEDHPYNEPMEMVIDDRRYPPEELNRMMPPQTRVEYDHVPLDYGHRDISRQRILRHVADRIDISDDSNGNTRKITISDHPTIPKRTIPEYSDMNRSSVSKHPGEYLGPGDNCFEFERSQEYETSHFDASQARQVSNFGRGTGPEFQKARSNNSPLSKYDSETDRMALKSQKMKEKEFHMYEPSDRIVKGKYVTEEVLSRPSFKNIMPGKLSAPQEFEDAYDSEEWAYEDMSDPQFTQRFGHEEYREVGRTYEEQDHCGDLTSDDWYASEDSLVPAPRPGIRFYKDSGKFVKGNTRLGSLSWHASHHSDSRSNPQKHIKVWKRNDYYDEDLQTDDCDMPEDLANLPDSDPSENTEEFKQLVNDAFLKYSKKLNLNQSVRRRYKEQGKAGSLFCIVCGRSYSKEFMDTQRLVNHCFMSHKVGLRTLHLGLHRAVCVLLGWDTALPVEAITWVPQVLPEAEALAQKDDLILWPPIVVIHNISMSNNMPQEQQVIPMEEVQAYLRGKGLIAGKVTVCLGRPADQSVIVVKFLGTFSGLANAEKLHKYFADNKRGRVEFQGIISGDGKSSSSTEKDNEGDKLEEQLLYGYMAISEDLDRLDFNNRKWSVIKSRKEIQDLANAPVKLNDR